VLLVDPDAPRHAAAVSIRLWTDRPAISRDAAASSIPAK
jgi:hypothetical protein